MRIVWDVWYGRRSLAETFWLWNIMLNIVVMSFIGPMIAAMFAVTFNSVMPFYVWTALFVLFSFWLLMGLWRCATRNPGGWATAAKAFIVVYVVYLFYMYGRPFDRVSAWLA